MKKPAIKTMSLFRVMCEEEFQQLMLTQKFTEGTNSLEGKWFAENLNDAIEWEKWFKQFEDVDNYRIIEMIIPIEIADTFFRRQQLDGIGPGRYAELEQLHHFTIKIIK